MAYNFKSEEEVKEFIQNLAIEYRFGCFHEKNPEACHLLGDYLETITREFKKALAVYKNNCDVYKFAHSCFKTGGYFMQGKGLPGLDDYKAVEYFDKGCKLGRYESCYRAGLLCFYSDQRVKDYTRGLGYLEEACSNGVQESCYDLSSFYISGDSEKQIKKDMVKAAYYSAIACNLDNAYACANLSRMYKLGDGVEQNEKLGEKLKLKALELESQEARKQEIKFQVGIDPVS